MANRLLDDPEIERVPRVVIFAGKAASAYYAAKQIIRLINDVAKVINNDPRVHTQLKVVFIPNYGVSLAQIIPAADSSEQISLAGTEASGTSNMKFALNGALTIGCWTAPTLRCASTWGGEHLYLRQYRRTGGGTAPQRLQPASILRAGSRAAPALTQIATGVFSPDEPKRYSNLFDSLVNPGITTSCWQITAATWIRRTRWTRYLNQDEWTRRAVLNIANMGYFSSDRTIQEYADEIWHIQPVKL